SSRIRTIAVETLFPSVLPIALSPSLPVTARPTLSEWASSRRQKDRRPRDIWKIPGVLSSSVWPLWDLFFAPFSFPLIVFETIYALANALP
ncbi:uncharacterized protein B0I36DRAFT_337074, partial [Microdochium trichocladiopsis]